MRSLGSFASAGSCSLCSEADGDLPLPLPARGGERLSEKVDLRPLTSPKDLSASLSHLQPQSHLESCPFPAWLTTSREDAEIREGRVASMNGGLADANTWLPGAGASIRGLGCDGDLLAPHSVALREAASCLGEEQVWSQAPER